MVLLLYTLLRYSCYKIISLDDKMSQICYNLVSCHWFMALIGECPHSLRLPHYLPVVCVVCVLSLLLSLQDQFVICD